MGCQIIKFYTDNDRYMGLGYIHKNIYLELISWTISGNYITCNGIVYNSDNIKDLLPL